MTASVLHTHPRILPGGGPHGYLDNLRQALAAAPGALRIEVLPLAEAIGGLPAGAPAPAGLGRTLLGVPGVRRLNHALRGEFAIRFEQAVADWTEPYEALTRSQAERLLSRDLTVVHDTFLAARLLRLAPAAARERLALMTHAPGFYAHQIAGELRPDEPESAWRDASPVRRLREREVETMLAAKAVAWPSHGAADAYLEWTARASGPAVLVATGVPRPVARASREEMRRRWGAEGGQHVALFLGRPHPQKGFDRFVDWADGRRGDRSWLFVQAGGPPRHSRRDLSAIRQVGYEADNGAAYLAADLVVFPNRCAYLDIGLLECLSLGAAAAPTRVGGHADLLRECPALPALDEGPDAWAGALAAAEAAATPASRAAREAAWAGRHSLTRFADEHRALAEALRA